MLSKLERRVHIPGQLHSWRWRFQRLNLQTKSVAAWPTQPLNRVSGNHQKVSYLKGPGTGLRLRDMISECQRKVFFLFETYRQPWITNLRWVYVNLVMISDYSWRQYIDQVLWCIVPPDETANGYPAPKAGCDVAHSLGISALLVKVSIVRQIRNVFRMRTLIPSRYDTIYQKR